MVDLASFLQDLRAKYAGINRPIQGLPADYAIGGPGEGVADSPSILSQMFSGEGAPDAAGGDPANAGPNLSSQLSSTGQQPPGPPQALGHMMSPMQADMVRNESGYGQVQGGYDPSTHDVTMRGLAGPQVSPMAGINFMANADPFPLYKSQQPRGGTPHGPGAPQVSPTAGAAAIADGGRTGSLEIKTGPDGMPIGPPPLVTPEHVSALLHKAMPTLSAEQALKMYPAIAGNLQKQLDTRYHEAAVLGALHQGIEKAKKSGDPTAIAAAVQRLRDHHEGVALKSGEEIPDAPAAEKRGGKKGVPGAIDKAAVETGPRNEDASPAAPEAAWHNAARTAIAAGADKDAVLQRLQEQGIDIGGF